MNLKFKKLYATLGVGLLSALSFGPILNTEAALTAPTSWTFKYTNENFPGYKLRSQTAVISTPTYTRTADSTYWNYTSTFTITTGLTATQTFNRSNSTWYDNAGTWIPSDSKIGSDNTVGSISNKNYISFQNNTNKDYRLFLDFSSNGGLRLYPLYILEQLITNGNSNEAITIQQFGLVRMVIPAYSNFVIKSFTSSDPYYFDAWYLQDLGVSAAYEAGVDDGYIQGQNEADLLVTGFSAMVGILVNFVLMIVNLEVFGVSLMGIFAIIVLFTGIVWFLKLIRG